MSIIPRPAITASSILILASASAFPAAPASIAAIEPQTEPGFHYMHRREPVPLRLDPLRIAILAQPGQKRPALFLPSSGDIPLPVEGWTMTTLTRPVQVDALKQLAGAGGCFVSPVFLDAGGGDVLLTPDILVRFRPGITAAAAADAVRGAGAGEIVQTDMGGLKNLYRVRSASPSGLDVLAGANRLAGHPEVEFAEPDLIVSVRLLDLIPNDEHFFRCWGLHSTGQDIVDGLDDLNPPLEDLFVTPGFDMDVPAAWDITTGDPAVITVVFDQGVQLDHPDLLIDASLGRDFTTDEPGGVPGGGPVTACDNHGTTIAGIVASKINNSIGGVGVAPGTRVASARVIVAECGKNGFTKFSWAIEGLDWAESIGARITNFSYTWGPPSGAFEAKIAESRAAGVLHFGAAGNDGEEGITYPASLDDFFAVGALDPFAADRWAESNYGKGLDACAPGVGIFTTDRAGEDGYQTYIVEDDYVFMIGTSFSAPMAAGVAALVLSARPSLSADEADSVLRRSCIDMGPDPDGLFYGHGRINAHRAVRLALCPADCDGSSTLDLFDFFCFVNDFNARGPYADCNGTGEYDLFQFLCFVNAFNEGC